MSIYKMRTEFGHQLKWLMAVLAIIFIIGAIFTFGSAPGSRSGGGAGGNDEVVATVNGMPITRGEMEANWNQTWGLLRDRGMRSTLQFAQERARVFQQMVESRVTLITAQEMGVEVSDRDVRDKRDQMITDYLKENRRRVMGKLSGEQEKVDPRSDADFKRALSDSGMSIGEIEDRADKAIPEGQIRFQLAQEGIRKAMTGKAGSATPDEIKASYNVYSVRQILMPKGNLPSEQLKTQVDKIVADAKAGGDFVALAKKYSADGSKGAARSISYGMVSPEVWDQLVKLKPGEVSPAIDTDQAVYIIKLESMANKLPAKFDKKTQEDRGKMIVGMRQMQEYMKVDKEVRSKLAVKVTDPELLGYWHLAQLQRPTPGLDAKKEISLATSAFKKAIGKDANNMWATALLAVLLKEQGDAKQSQQLLYQLLEGDSSRGDGADLRIMLGDMLWQAGKKTEAGAQYAKAAEAAGFDPTAHQQLVAKFKQIGRSDLAANEQRWLVDYQAKKKAMEAQQGKSAPVRTP